MSNKRNLKTDPSEEPRPQAGGSSKEKAAFSHQPLIYQIRIEGYLSHQWTEWFEGLTITLEENGDTLLIGPVIDQAALFGLLRKVRDLAMPLISVVRVEPGQANVKRSTD